MRCGCEGVHGSRCGAGRATGPRDRRAIAQSLTPCARCRLPAECGAEDPAWLQGIGYADVADVCLRALHAPEAVNKTFEVCYETTPDGDTMGYELVAHMPDRSTNILKQALVGLERNT